MKREEYREAEEEKARMRLDYMRRRWPFNFRTYQILLIVALFSLLIAVMI